VKLSLGSLLLLLLLPWQLYAEDFVFRVTVNTTHPYLKAPVHLAIDLNQTNHDIVLFYKFALKPSDMYRIEQIDGKHDDTLYRAHHHYDYILYPLKEGKINIAFTMIKRITDEQKLAYSASGDRDDFKKLQTKDMPVALPPVILDVKPLPQGTKLIGDFTLSVEIPQRSVKAYEPIPLNMTIEGEGYPPLLDPLIPKIEGVTRFFQKPQVEKYPTKAGIGYRVHYTLALSAEHTFTLPEVTIPAFDPDKNRRYALTIPSAAFTVTKEDVNTLVDTIDTPPPYRISWEWLYILGEWLMIFGAGFVSGRLWRWQRIYTPRSIHPLVAKIDAARDKKTLLRVLMAHDAHRFAPLIEKIDKDLYDTRQQTLKSLKQEAKELLK